MVFYLLETNFFTLNQKLHISLKHVYVNAPEFLCQKISVIGFLSKFGLKLVIALQKCDQIHIGVDRR